MTGIDWAIVALFVLAAAGIGMAFARKASRSAEDFFVAGRSLPWFIAGTSMVASGFSSDTPLFVAGLVREQGIYANWFWWVGVLGVLVSVFFFARLWHRSGALTEIELLAIRYAPGRATDLLRMLKAAFDGVFVNCIIIASVTLAMSKIIVAILGLPDAPILTLPLLGNITTTGIILAGLAAIAVVYTTLSGLYGVVYTDLIQFALAMLGSIALAAIAYADLSASGGFVSALRAAPGFSPETVRFFPPFERNLETVSFVIFLLIGWWNYAPGTGYFLQRTLAARSERDAMLALYWFGFCHLAIRSWPWIIVGLASLIYFPNIADAESAYPRMIDSLLPAGLKGIMIASLLAAFMSTLDTHLNWGASYIVNDIYKPFVRPGRGEKHYVLAARISMLVLAATALLVAAQLSSILGAYQYILVILIPVSSVLIARWYWWRINIWSEFAAVASAAIVGNLTMVLLPDSTSENWFAVRMLITTISTAIAVLIVTLATSRREPSAHVVDFYRKLRIHGRGWQRIRESTGVTPVASNLRQSAAMCVASIALIYSTLLGIGALLLDEWPRAGMWVTIGVVTGFYVYRKMPEVVANIRKDTV